MSAPEQATVASRPCTLVPGRSALLLVLSAIAVRFIVFTSRGDYVAFDEGWYLLLGRSVFDGEGFRLSGLRHTTLSPLFPLAAGLADAVVGNRERVLPTRPVCRCNASANPIETSVFPARIVVVVM